MELIKVGRCGFSYFKVENWGKFGNTLEDVLKEIKEYTENDIRFRDLGEGFGCPASRCNNAWAIYIETDHKLKVYKSCWRADDTLWEKYNGNESEVVKSIYGSGDWYCAIDFHIIIEEFN